MEKIEVVDPNTGRTLGILNPNGEPEDDEISEEWKKKKRHTKKMEDINAEDINTKE
jgi:hypothetical protein